MFTLKIPINKCYLVYEDSMIPLEGVRNYVLCASKKWCAYFHYLLIPLCSQNASILLADCVLKHFISFTLPPLFCVHLSQVVLHPHICMRVRVWEASNFLSFEIRLHFHKNDLNFSCTNCSWMSMCFLISHWPELLVKTNRMLFPGPQRKNLDY